MLITYIGVSVYGIWVDILLTGPYHGYMNPFYDFANRTVHAPVAGYLHIFGYACTMATPGRVLAENLSADEAFKEFGPIVGFNLKNA